MNDKNNHYVLGLDLGVASIGWSVVEIDNDEIATQISDHGVVIFSALDNNKGKLRNQTRRDARGLRRVLRRRKERLRRVKSLLKTTFNLSSQQIEDFFTKEGKSQNNHALELKVKGLSESLTQEELIRVLVHYAKNRGFKSNRKADADNEKGKMKEAIAGVHTIMLRDQCTVSKAVLTMQKENNYATIHNVADHYIYGFERADVEDEINLLLDKQISFYLVDETFKAKYMEIWSSQRDYSEGPDTGPYKVEFEAMFGNCLFRTKEKRISRACPSFDIFTVIQKLQNIRYYKLDEDDQRVTEGRRPIKYSLTQTQIYDLYTAAFKDGKKLTYDLLEKTIIGNSNDLKIEICDLPKLSRNDFNKIVSDYKTTHGIENRLNESEYSEIKKQADKKVKESEVIRLKAYLEFRKLVKKIGKDSKYLEIEWMDDVATILAYAKTDNAVDRIIENHYKGQFNEEEISIIKKLKVSVSGSGSLSLSLVQDLNKLLIEGETYSQAMQSLGYDHSKYLSDKNFNSVFPTVAEIEETYETRITQPNVRHVLVYLRKLYKAIYEQYGEPTYVHIEVATEIKNSFSKRNEIKYNQLNNQIENEKARLLMVETLGFTDIEHRTHKSFSQDDILKFRLWRDQDGICMYTGQEIEPAQLLDRNAFQVDHILPFSRTFDNSYTNKILVTTQSNQEKKNRTPYEWLHAKSKDDWNEFVERVRRSKVDEEKKNKLLMKEEITYDEFTSQSLHATSYVSKLAIEIFKDLLNTDENNDRVRSFKGNATSYLRKYYGINNFTHSYESEDYNRNNTRYYVHAESLKIESSAKDAKITIVAKDQYDHQIEFIKTITKTKDNHFRSLEDEQFYRCISEKEKLQELINELLIESKKDIFKIEDYKILSNGYEFEYETKLIYELLIGLKAKLLQKNRDNHFHHEVDATLVAIMTRSMQIKITKFHQLWQDLGNDEQIYDEQTGEYYTKENIKSYFNIDKMTKNSKFYIPQPYDHFIDELKVKIFERDQDILCEKLRDLSVQNANECIVKYPSYQVDNRVSGSLHAETIYGRKQEQGVTVNTLRTHVSKLDKKKIEMIYDKDSGQKQVYESLKKWVESGKKGSPTLPSGQVINKVKLKDTNVEKMVSISPDDPSKGYAMMGELARIQVYKKEGSDKLHFVQISVLQYLKIKANDHNFDVLVWRGRGENNKELINYNQLSKHGYTLYRNLYPGQHISVIMNTGASALCRVVGFSSGLFEIDSILGDTVDLIEKCIVKKDKSQLQLTVSTIKDIKLESIDIMGNLNVF